MHVTIATLTATSLRANLLRHFVASSDWDHQGEIVLDLVELWGLARRHWLMLLASLLGGLALAAGYSFIQPVLYSATASGYVVAGNSATVGDAFAGSNLAAEKAETYLPLVKSQAVAERVAEDLDLESPGSVASSLAGTVTGSVIFEITATATSPELARDMADAALDATSAEAVALESLTPSGISTGNTVIRIVPVQQADTPTEPVSPNWTRNLVMGLVLGLMAGFGIVLLRHTFDRRVRQSSDAEEITGAATLAVVPKADELVNSTSLARNMGAAAEALRQLRTNLRFVRVDDPPRSIVVTSSNAGEGKSTIAAHLASMLAESGQATVLVDADLRRPMQAKLFDVDGTVGLTQVVAGSADLADCLVATQQENLLLLPAGRIPPNPAELVGSGRMQSLITSLEQSFTVIIDAPPLLPVTDAELLTVASDGALLVVQTGKTRTEQVALATRKLEQVDGTLLGVVMNMVPKKELGSVVYGYGYGTYSPQYYYGADQPEGRRRGGAVGAPGRSRRRQQPHHSVESVRAAGEETGGEPDAGGNGQGIRRVSLDDLLEVAPPEAKARPMPKFPPVR